MSAEITPKRRAGGPSRSAASRRIETSNGTRRSSRVVTDSQARSAARAKVIVDKKLGRVTEQWIKDLAKRDD